MKKTHKKEIIGYKIPLDGTSEQEIQHEITKLKERFDQWGYSYALYRHYDPVTRKNTNVVEIYFLKSPI